MAGEQAGDRAADLAGPDDPDAGRIAVDMRHDLRSLATSMSSAWQQAAIAGVFTDSGEPAGTLKVSMPPSFGVTHVLPLLPGFLSRYPHVQPEWHFENRAVDLVAEGYDAWTGSATPSSRSSSPSASRAACKKPAETGCFPPDTASILVS
jgi:DNA-binding transcriptional LysR family regulator